MSQFRRPHRFSCDIVDDCNASRFAFWIELDTQRLEYGLLYCYSENNCERVSTIHSRLVLFQEQAGMFLMHLGGRPLLCFLDEQLWHTWVPFFFSFEAPLCRVVLN